MKYNDQFVLTEIEMYKYTERNKFRFFAKGYLFGF